MVKLITLLIGFYQRFISPFKGTTCRFYPSCSQYAIHAYQKYGLLKGSRLTAARLARCHPWHDGGYDPVR